MFTPDFGNCEIINYIRNEFEGQTIVNLYIWGCWPRTIPCVNPRILWESRVTRMKVFFKEGIEESPQHMLRHCDNLARQRRCTFCRCKQCIFQFDSW